MNPHDPTPGRRDRFPPDIMEEIFCNLPVKSLNRFRSFSKYWHASLSDRHFIRRYLTTVHFQKTLTQNEYLDTIPLCTLQTTGEGGLPIPLPKDVDLRLVTSCDGFLCIRFDSTVYIWNPSMKNKYVAVALPAEYQLHYFYAFKDRLCVCLREMLCFLSYGEEGIVLWATKDCSDQNNWIRILEMSYDVFFCKKRYIDLSEFKALYLYENGEVLIGAMPEGRRGKTELLICKDSEVLVRRITRHDAAVIWTMDLFSRKA